MAMLIQVEYPNGERAVATGYPRSILVVQIIPRGPEACHYDELECDFSGREPYRVTRIVGGPRVPAEHVRVELDAAGREAWMDAREAEGYDTRESDEDPQTILVVRRTA